jgi:hypothetical protein
VFSINIIVLVRYYIVSNFFIKRNKRSTKHLLVYKYKRRLYINFFMRLFLSLKHSRDYVNIVIIVIKSVVIAIDCDKENNSKYNKEDNNNYDCTTIVSIFNLAFFIKEMHSFYNLFFAL